MTLIPRAFPIVIAAPSGAGKTSLARKLVERHDDIVFSVSATTRPARSYESSKDYMFVSEQEFDRMIAADELLEWALVHGNKYGTPWAGVRSAIDAGHNVLLDIDVQGARQIRARFPGAVLIFILPPSAGELVRRLTGRGSELAEARRTRLENARSELPAVEAFDYVVVNDNFERAVATLEAIVCAERHRYVRAGDLNAELQRLDREIDIELQRSE